MNLACFEKKPRQALLIFLLLHALCWTVLPALVNPNLPIDVIEGLDWGHEWQLGYHKHPPIKPWFLEATAVLSHRSDWAFYLLSQLCVVVAFWAVWRLAKEFVSPRWALVSVLILEGIYYHNYTSPEFNVNVAELPFWALTGLFSWVALTKGRPVHWILLGLFMALGVLAKYLFGFLVLAVAVMMVAVPFFRKTFKTAGPYLAGLTAFLVVLPHLLWAANHNFITLTYGLNRAGGGHLPAVDHILLPLRFLAGQALILIPCLIMLWTLRSGEPGIERPVHDPVKGRFLLFLTLGPPGLMVLLSVIFGWKIRSMWGTPLFLFSGVALIYFLGHRLTLARFPAFSKAWFVFFILPLVAYGVEANFVPMVTGQANRVHFPGPELSQTVLGKWHGFEEKPPGVAIGHFWDAGNFSYHSPENRPSVFINGDPIKSPWITDEKIRGEGAVVIGRDRQHAYALLPKGMEDRVKDMGEIILPYRYWGKVPPVSFWILFLLPEKAHDL